MWGHSWSCGTEYYSAGGGILRVFSSSLFSGAPSSGWNHNSNLASKGSADGLVLMNLRTECANRTSAFREKPMNSLLGEPICSTLLAYALFHETLTVVQIGGAVLILIGIYLAARAEGR